MDYIRKTGIIILAAGNSSRLGMAKQLLSFEGKSLLRRITDEALAHPEHCVFVVLGASNENIAKELNGSKAAYCINTDWQQGMAGSIKTGLKMILHTAPDLEQCIISVCDQPYIDSTVFEGLKTLAATTGKGIITTGFAHTWGVPVLFTKPYFDRLFDLDGDEGAKKMIQKHTEDMAIFPFEPAQIDIDTPADYYNLNHQLPK